MQNAGTLPSDHLVTVTTSDAPEIAKQMKWIAKGLAGIADLNAIVKAEIHTQVELTYFYAESNSNLDLNLFTALGFDYDQEVDGWLQGNIPGNDYNSAYFFDIDIDDCKGKVSVKIPEADIVDQTKLHVVTAEDVFDVGSQTTGYYITGLGLLDSLQVNEGNMDSVYLWVVGLDNDCGDSTICGDGVLDPGETCESCPEDCPTTLHTTDPSSDTYKLILKEVKLWTDNKNAPGGHPNFDYQEAFL